MCLACVLVGCEPEAPTPKSGDSSKATKKPDDKADADKAKADADKLKADADKVKEDAAKAAKDVEDKAKADADRIKADADKAAAEARKTVDDAASKAKTEADKLGNAAKDAAKDLLAQTRLPRRTREASRLLNETWDRPLPACPGFANSCGR